MTVSDLVYSIESRILERWDCSQQLNQLRMVALKETNRKKSADSFFKLGEVAKYLDMGDVAEECFVLAIRYAGWAGDKLCEANASKGLADIELHRAEKAFVRGHIDDQAVERSNTLYGQAAKLYKESGSPDGVVTCAVQLGTLAMYRRPKDGDPKPEIAKILEQLGYARKLADQHCQLRNLASYYGTMGLIQLRLGDFENAADSLEQARKLYEKDCCMEGLASCLQALGSLAYNQGMAAEAASYWRDASALFDGLKDSRGVEWCRSRLAGLGVKV